MKVYDGNLVPIMLQAVDVTNVTAKSQPESQLQTLETQVAPCEEQLEQWELKVFRRCSVHEGV